MYYRSWICALLLAGLIPLQAQSYERSRELSRAFRATETTVLQIENKYGNIHLVPWDKDSIRFDIQFRVRGTKPSRVDRMFQDVDFDFTANRYYVVGRTIFSNTMNSLWSEINDMTNILLSTDSRASIDYTVYYPERSPLRIDLRFGNIYATDVAGKADIRLSNGDLKVHDFLAELSLDHQFGNAFVSSMGQATLKLGYGEFELGEGGKLDVTGRAARIRIRQCEHLRLDSRRGRIRLESCDMVLGSASFSYIHIDRLKTDLSLTTTYGELRISEIDPGFRQIDIRGSYTDIHLLYPAGTLFHYELTRSEKTRLNLSEPLRTSRESPDPATPKTFIRSGKLGSNPGNMLKIKNTGGTISILPK